MQKMICCNQTIAVSRPWLPCSEYKSIASSSVFADLHVHLWSFWQHTLYLNSFWSFHHYKEFLPWKDAVFALAGLHVLCPPRTVFGSMFFRGCTGCCKFCPQSTGCWAFSLYHPELLLLQLLLLSFASSSSSLTLSFKYMYTLPLKFSKGNLLNTKQQ